MVKQLDLKFTPHVQGKLQVATYATVKDSIIQHIQKTFKDGNDVAQSLKDGVVFDLNKQEPEREISEVKDPDKAAFEQAGFDIGGTSPILWLKRQPQTRFNKGLCLDFH